MEKPPEHTLSITLDTSHVDAALDKLQARLEAFTEQAERAVVKAREAFETAGLPGPVSARPGVAGEAQLHEVRRGILADMIAGLIPREQAYRALSTVGGLSAADAEGLLEAPPQDFPIPYVVRPTVLQVVKGARVEWESKPGVIMGGWAEKAGLLPTDYRGISEPEPPKAPGVLVSVNQPGASMMTFLAPTFVPIEKVLRVTCAPDPSPEACWKCQQSGEPKGGEIPCEACHRPTVHDDDRETLRAVVKPVTIGEPGRDKIAVKPSSRALGGISIEVKSPDGGIALTRQEAEEFIKAAQPALDAQTSAF